MALRDLGDLAQLLGDLRLRALDLDDQQRLDIRVTGVDEILAGADAGAVHELDRDRQHARLDDVGDAGPGHLVGIEAHQHRARALGLGEDPQRRLGDDAELAFRAADHAQQVIDRRVEMGAADLDHLALHRDHGHAQQVVGGDAVFQAMRPARVHRDVAGDGAGQLARRVGGVEEAVGLDRAGDAEVGAPGLDPDDAIVVVGLEHPVQPRHAQDHAVGGGQRAARQRGARAPRHHRHALLVANLQHRGDLGGRPRQHCGQRRAAIGAEPVALVGLGLGRVRDHRAVGQHRLQAVDDLGLPRKNGGVRVWHMHSTDPPKAEKRILVILYYQFREFESGF